MMSRDLGVLKKLWRVVLQKKFGLFACPSTVWVGLIVGGSESRRTCTKTQYVDRSWLLVWQGNARTLWHQCHK